MKITLNLECKPNFECKTSKFGRLRSKIECFFFRKGNVEIVIVLITLHVYYCYYYFVGSIKTYSVSKITIILVIFNITFFSRYSRIEYRKEIHKNAEVHDMYDVAI